MQSVRGKGTSLERRLFATLAGLGVKGWQKNFSGLPGKPDVAFLSRKVAIFVDGCFWHGCPICRKKLPITNRMYWKDKITRNISISRKINRQLLLGGWKILRIWEHEIQDRSNKKVIQANILTALKRQKDHGFKKR
jgi:DNA mismatch endonuclease (patch repair protein)